MIKVTLTAAGWWTDENVDEQKAEYEAWVAYVRQHLGTTLWVTVDEITARPFEDLSVRENVVEGATAEQETLVKEWLLETGVDAFYTSLVQEHREGFVFTPFGELVSAKLEADEEERWRRGIEAQEALSALLSPPCA